MFLIGNFFCRSRIVSWETGFRIDSRTIKRGSQAGVSFASFGESSNWDAQGKGMFLIGNFFCRSRIVSWETGFRIDSRTIKRGSQAGVSFASFGESSNLCI